MSISATTNYMSNADFLVWMEQKTEAMYGNLTSAMQSADTNGDAEAALNKIRGDIANSKTNGGDAAAIHDEVNEVLAKYGDTPGVADVLQPIADHLNSQYGTSNPVNVPAPQLTNPDPNSVAVQVNPWTTWGTPNNAHTVLAHYTAPVPPAPPKPVKISSDEVDSWTKNIDNTVSDLGKKDQLALINIQELNSQINQAKQTASALMDSADKSANSIISHIG
jgi:hypothetical protein